MILAAALFTWWFRPQLNFNFSKVIGQPIDSLNNVLVYYNGGIDNNAGRSITADNYNIGIKYQCVEFVKRYYLQHLHHKMPDTFGNACDYFDCNVADGELNKRRNLLQFTNGSSSKPQPDDLVVFEGSRFNSYGHVAIITAVHDRQLEIIQQNPGPFGSTRIHLKLKEDHHKWTINAPRVLGWLRINK